MHSESRTPHPIRLSLLTLSIALLTTVLAFWVIGSSDQAGREPGRDQSGTALFSPLQAEVKEVLEKEATEIPFPAASSMEESPYMTVETDPVEQNLPFSETNEDWTVSMRRPSEVARTRFAPAEQERLAGRLPEALQPVWHALRAEFPEVDFVEMDPFYGMLLEKRDQFGHELTRETADAYAAWVQAAETIRQELIALHAADLGISLTGMEEDRGYHLVGFVDGVPSYTLTQNVEAAISTGANLVRWNADFDPAIGPVVDGTGLYVNVNDHGTIYEHAEFQLPNNGGSRIVDKEVNDSGSRAHMTHVAGTVAAWGYDSRLLGMAPRVWMRSYIQQYSYHILNNGMRVPGEMQSHVNPVTGELEMKSVMGNTSLGTIDPNTRYTASSANFDTLLIDHPYYVHFYAASNYGSGFETLGGNNPIGKNVFNIGNVNDIQRDAEGNFVSGGSIVGSSSRGPTFDGRIKPDFVANGASVRSTAGTTGSRTTSGTSMASPNAAGSVVLLIDYYRQKFPGQFLRSSTYKALLMNTADDLGNPGPNYTYGWGAINVYAAGQVIRQHADNPSAQVLIEDRLASSQTWTRTYVSTGEPIRASLAWLDPAGPSQLSSSTDRSPRLVNDLDMRIIGPSGTHLPFVMPFTTGQGGTPAFDASLYTAPAVTGNNRVDPAEQIIIPAPPAGQIFTIEITHEGPLQGGHPQQFSLVVSGLVAEEPTVPVVTAFSPALSTGASDVEITVEGSGFVLGSRVLLRRQGQSDVEAGGLMILPAEIKGILDTQGLEAGYWDVVVRHPDGTEGILNNGFLVPILGAGTQTLYSSIFDNADGLTLTGDWVVGVPNQAAVGGPGSAHQGTQVLGTYLNGNYENNINIFATLPVISTVGVSDLNLSFRRWLGLAYHQQGNPNQQHRDDARIHWSTDGSTWNLLWASNSAFNESSWTAQSFNLPSGAANQPSLYLRFQLQTDGSQVSYGFNIDSLSLTGSGSMVYPPAFTSSPPATSLIVGDSYSYSITASDPDTPGSGLSFAAIDLPAGLALTDHGDGTATLAGTPGISGIWPITLLVTDGDYITYQSFTLAVEPEGGNTLPVIVTETLPTALATQGYQTTIHATDADGHSLSFSVSGLPAWAQFVDQGDGSAILSGTPGAQHAGTRSFTVTVTDGFGSVDKTFSLVVEVPTYTVQYLANGADGEVPEPQEKTHNIALELPGVGSLEKANHAFVGWNTQADGNGTVYLPGDLYTMNEDLTLYAQWVTSYTVVIDFGKEDQETTSPGHWNNIIHPLYESGDWEPQDTTIMPALRRFSDGGQAGVRLKVGGGRAGIGGLDIPTEDQDTNAAFTVSGTIPPSAQRDIAFFSTEGHPELIFENLDDDMVFRLEFQSLHTSTTPAATWTIQPGTPHEQVRMVSRNKGAEHYSPVQVFQNISTNGNGRIILRASGTENQNINALSLTATFSDAPSYTVTYDGNQSDSGTPPADNNSYAVGSTVTVQGNPGNLTKADAFFAGWNTQADGTGASYVAGSTFTMPAGDVTLYAQWRPYFSMVVDFGRTGQETNGPGYWNNATGSGDWADNTTLVPSLVRYADGVATGVSLQVQRVDGNGRAGIGGLDIIPADQDSNAAFTVSGTIPASAQRDIAYTSSDGKVQFVFANLDDSMSYQLEFQTLHTTATDPANWTVQPGTAHEQIRLISRNKGAAHYSPVQVFENIQTDGNGRIILRSAGDIAQNINAIELTASTADTPPPPPPTHTVTFTAGTGGSLSGDLNQTVIEGDATTAVTAEADEGYSFINWTWTGDNASTTNPLSISNVTEDITVTAHFEEVVVPNTPPSVVITAPADNTTVTQGDTVTFTGTATDAEDDDAALLASAAWTSDRDGAVGTGGSVSTTTLSVGTHIITFAVIDSGGLSDSDQITLTVASAEEELVLVRYTFENVAAIGTQHSTSTFIRQVDAVNVAAEITASPFAIGNHNNHNARVIATDSVNGIAGAVQIAGIQSNLFQWEAGASGNPYYEFTVDGATALESLRIVARSGSQWNNTGTFLGYEANRQAEISIRSSLDNYGANIGSVFTAGNAGAFAEQIIDLSGLVPDGQAVTIRIYPRSPNTSDTWYRVQVDQVEVTGTVSAPPEDLYEEWALENNITGGLADETNGIPNLLRYALGGTADSSAATLQPIVETNVDTLTFRFQRIADPALHYEVWASNDLVNWGASPIWSSTGIENNAGEIVVSDSVLISEAPRRFFRLVVWRE